jgi:hypothetical protein
MNYQGIRAKFESPLYTAYNALSPAVPIYFDNVLNTASDGDSEFIEVNIQFGLTTEATLTGQTDLVRGIVVVRAYSEKGKGPGRNQTLIDTAFTALSTINATGKPDSGIYVRTGSIDGPSFGTGSTDQESRVAFTPYFISRIETDFTAQVIS